MKKLFSWSVLFVIMLSSCRKQDRTETPATVQSSALQQFMAGIASLTPQQQADAVKEYIEQKSSVAVKNKGTKYRTIEDDYPNYWVPQGGQSEYLLWPYMSWPGANTYEVEWNVLSNSYWNIQSSESITVTPGAPPMVTAFQHNGAGAYCNIPIWCYFSEGSSETSPASFPYYNCIAVSRVIGQLEIGNYTVDVDNYCSIKMCL